MTATNICSNFGGFRCRPPVIHLFGVSSYFLVVMSCKLMSSLTLYACLHVGGMRMKFLRKPHPSTSVSSSQTITPNVSEVNLSTDCS